MDELSAMNLSGAAAKPLAGENDLAQNPFDVDAEYGPSLFDARHRFVASASWEPRVGQSVPAALRALLAGLAGERHRVAQLRHAVHGVRLGQRLAAGQQPADFRASPRAGRTWSAIRTPARAPWTPGSADRPSSGSIPQTQAGQFGNAGRNIARGPAYTNVDVSLVRNISFGDGPRLQLRAESFNVLNHPNFGLPVADLNSPNFGRILSAGPPRLMQFAVKVSF